MTAAGSSTLSYTALDLFAGAGGFSLGLEAAGFRCLGAIESDPVASCTLKANFGELPVSFLGAEGDIRNLNVRALRSHLQRAGVDELDVLVAAPPCQGFSRVGRGKLDSIGSRNGSFADDIRNDLYEQAIRILRGLRPRAFVFENVSGMLHLRGRNVAEDVCAAVARAGYVVRCTLLNAAWYGVPQTRERVFIIGVRTDLAMTPTFPARLFHADLGRGHLSDAELDSRNWTDPEYFVDPRGIPRESRAPAVTVGEAFDDLPPFTSHLKALRNGHRYRPLRGECGPVPYAAAPRNWYCRQMRFWNKDLVSRDVRDHFCRWTPRDFGTFAKMVPGDRYPEALEVAEMRYRHEVLRHRWLGGKRPQRREFVPPYPADSFPDKWRKLVSGAPSWTVTAHLGKDTYSHIHFDSRQARSITIREAARLQSFPDAFVLSGNMGDALRQIGNAVPPLLAREVGGALRDLLTQVDRRVAQRRKLVGREWKSMQSLP